jgi:hypothetical protein
MNDLTTPTNAAPAALTDFAMSVESTLKQAALIQQVMAAVMKDGEHYGVVPGTQGKKSLFKSGAEKLSFVFGLSNKLDIRTSELPGGHREYTITCDLFDRAGNMRGQGVGSASTMESKHRYRGAAGKECPKCHAMACKGSKKEYGGGYYCDQKGGGCGWATKGGTAECLALDKVAAIRAENQDPADQYNTVLKMAKKRALVDAVLTATAASDIFAQDLEDLEASIDAEHAKDPAPAAPAAARTAPTQPAAAPAKPAPTPTHPALAAANGLWATLEQKGGKGTGTPVLKRLAKLYNAEAPKLLDADHLDAFGRDIEELAKDPDPARIEDILGGWEIAQREAAQNGGQK